MAIYRVQGPDGAIHRFEGPDGATPQQVEAFASQQFSKKPEAAPVDQDARERAAYQEALKDMNPVQRGLAGAGKTFVDTYNRGRQLLSQVGIGDQAAIQKEIDDVKRQSKPLQETTAGKVGEFGGNVAQFLPTSFIPGANTYRGAALLGAAQGFMQPVATGDSALENTALGAVSGTVGQAIGKGVSRVISPKASKNPDVQLLLSEGVTPTPGQILGGRLATTEEKMTSLPILGDAIKSSQKKGLDEFNKAALKRSVEPIGGKVDDIGREGYQQVSKQLKNAYDDIIPQLSFKPDKQFNQEFSTLVDMSDNLAKPQKNAFDKIIENTYFKKSTPQGNMSGETYKEIESKLGSEARGYLSSADWENRKLGQALMEARRIMRENLTRSNPEQASRLNAINEGYANFTRLRDAGTKLGTDKGVFTPSQLQNAVRAGDSSMKKGNFLKGDALMQDLSDAGVSVLKSKYPDSGTAGRMLADTAALGAYFVKPAIPLSLGAASVPYLPGGRQAIAAALARRPEAAQSVANAIDKAALLGRPGTNQELAKLLWRED